MSRVEFLKFWEEKRQADWIPCTPAQLTPRLHRARIRVKAVMARFTGIKNSSTMPFSI